MNKGTNKTDISNKALEDFLYRDYIYLREIADALIDRGETLKPRLLNTAAKNDIQ